MEQRRGAVSRLPARFPAQGPAEDQARGPALRTWKYPNGNRVHRDSDFCLVHAASIALGGYRLVDKCMRLSIRIGRRSDMGSAANLASRDTVNACVRRTLVQKSGGSNSAASDLYLFVYRLACFLCGTYGCLFVNYWGGRRA